MHLKWVSSLMIFLRYQIEENNLVGCRYLFGDIVNLFTHKLLIYSEPLVFQYYLYNFLK